MHLEVINLRDFAARYTAAWCSQNAASVAEFYSPDGSLTVNGGTPAIGRREITDAAQSFMSAFPDMQVLMDDLLVNDETAEYYWTLVGTTTGPGGKGKRVHISGYEEWSIGPDRLIASSHGHFNAAEYQRQLEHGADEE